MPNTIKIYGGEGEFQIDAKTGAVVTARENMPGDYDRYHGATFDLAEHLAFWRPHDGADYQPTDIDVCDIGLTWPDGKSEPAIDEFRLACLDDRAMSNPVPFHGWRYRALAYLKSRYALESNDIDADRLRSDFVDGWKPDESIDAMAHRFGLIPAEEWTPARATAFMSRFSIY